MIDAPYTRALLGLLSGCLERDVPILEHGWKLAMFNANVHQVLSFCIRAIDEASRALCAPTGALTSRQRRFAVHYLFSRAKLKNSSRKAMPASVLAARSAMRYVALSRGQMRAIREVSGEKIDELTTCMASGLFVQCALGAAAVPANIEGALADAGWFAPLIPHLAKAWHAARSERGNEGPAPLFSDDGALTAQGKRLLNSFGMHVSLEAELAKEAGAPASFAELTVNGRKTCAILLRRQRELMRGYL